MASDSQPADLQWQIAHQGKTLHLAHCQRDVLIIVSNECLEGPDIVPRHDTELTKEDIEKLQRLNLPNPEQWKDDASIMKARYELDKQYCGRVTVKRGETRQSILEACEILMKSTTKAGVKIHYIGPGKRNTGDWCFEDGFITFRDLAELYINYFKGHIFGISTDCSYSGSWVKELTKFLDEQGVQPCGHSAREKGLLIKIDTSCKSNEIPYRLFNSIRQYTNDKNKGTVSGCVNGWEVADGQHISFTDPTILQCGVKSIEEPCALSPNLTWQRHKQEERVYLVRGKDKGRPAWHYVLLVDDEETIQKFKDKVKSGTLDVADYGQVLKSGWGKDPPNEVKDWIDKQYSTVYT